MADMQDRVSTFVKAAKKALDARATKGLPEVKRYRLRSIVSACRTKATPRFFAALESQLAASGLHIHPDPSAGRVEPKAWVHLSTAKLAPEDLLFPKERDLQAFVAASLGTGPFQGLRLYRERKRELGREFRLKSGKRIDLLCQEVVSGDLVAIELKKKLGPEAVHQMLGYIQALAAQYPKRAVRGIIITGKVDDVMLSMIRHQPITCLQYKVEFTNPADSTQARRG